MSGGGLKRIEALKLNQGGSMGVVLNADQDRVKEAALAWFFATKTGGGQKPCLTIGGYAGTGKTTTLGEIAREIKKHKYKIAYCCFAGKAASVLRSKINDFFSDEEDYCGTIHSLIYDLRGKEKTEGGRERLVFENKGDEIDFDLIVLDESSMINKPVFEDIRGKNIPILAFGDHGQLPPVEGTFNLMEEPDLRLEKIVRQAEDNPIIKLSMMARLEGRIPVGDYGGQVVKTLNTQVLNTHLFQDVNSIVLAFSNNMRQKINTIARETLVLTEEILYPSQPIICLNNNHIKKFYNGEIALVQAVKDCGSWIEVRLSFGDRTFECSLPKEQFGAVQRMDLQGDSRERYDLFDWAYCLTVHKSQGSEWENVLLIDEPGAKYVLDEKNYRRWLYTAISRAKKNLTILVPAKKGGR